MRNLLNSLTLFLMVCCFAGVTVNAAEDKPNIVFIYADDWGWGDLSCHGHEWLKTPNIDRLASEGMDFQQFNVLMMTEDTKRVELHNLKTDRAEDAGNELSKSHPEIVARLKKMLLDWKATLPTQVDPNCVSPTRGEK